MKVSVAICTWNRADLLDQTLTQMCELRIPEGVEWELLVVNNNCTDHTDEVIERHASVLPIRRLFEEKQGQSNARNCALDAAVGELLIWTDDDVLVGEDWLLEYYCAAGRWPDVGYFSGPIVPWYETTPPKWFLDNEAVLGGVLARCDRGGVERLLAAGRWPNGANMAIRRKAYARFRFDPHFGLTGDDAIRYDEHVYCEVLNQAGFDGVWVPTASVQHFISSSRLTPNYLWKYYVGQGRGRTRKHSTINSRGEVLGAPRWVYRSLLESGLLYLANRAIGRPQWVKHYISIADAWGRIVESRLQCDQDANRRVSPSRNGSQALELNK